MSHDVTEENSTTERLTAVRKSRRRRRWLIGVGTAAAVAALLALVVFVLPKYAARLYVDHKIEEMGLVSSGIETIDIDIWNREIVVGPIAVGPRGEEPARLGHFSLTFSLDALFDRRGFTPTVLIRGVDLVMTRDAEGRLLVNDITVITPNESGTTDTQDQTGSPLQGWGFGLGSLSVRDSRLVFHEKTFESGGTLVVQIDRLDLSDFQTWTPQDPGRFEIDARLNDIAVDVRGTARPFADQVTFEAISEINEASVDKVERFTGPVKVVRAVGEVSSRLKHVGTLKEDGTLSLSNAGTITIEGGRLQLPGDMTLASDTTTLEFQLENAIAPDLSGHISGRLSARIDTLQTKSDLGTLTAASLDLAFDTIEAVRWLEGDKRNMRTSLAPGRLTISEVAFAGPAEQSAQIAKFTTTLETMRIKKDSDNTLSFELAGAVSGNALKARQPVPESDGSHTGSVEQVRLGGISAKVEIPGQGQTSWQVSGGVEGNGISFDLAGRDAFRASAGKLAVENARYASEPAISADRVSVSTLDASVGGTAFRIENIALRDIVGTPPTGGASEAGWKAQLSGAAETISLAIPAAQDLKASARSIDLDGFTYRAVDGLGAQILKLSGLNLRNQLGTARAETFTIRNVAADPSAESGDGWEVALSAATESVEIQVADGKPFTAKARKLELEGGQYSVGTGLAAKAFLLHGLDATVNSTITEVFGAKKDEQEDAEEGMRFQVGEIAVADTAKLQYIDTPQKTPVTIDARIDKFRMDNLDSKPNSPSPVALVATINEYASLNLSGTVSPFAPTPHFDVQGQIENLSLPHYSPYVEKLAGLHVETGTMSVSAKGEVSAQGSLDALMKLDLRNLEFSVVADESAQEMASRTGGLNPNAAANWLQDSKGKIELSIPISGNINEPKFDFEQVVAKAIGGAIRSTITTTLKLAFPPALLISALQDSKRGIAIKPVTFQPLGSSLGRNDDQLLASIGDLLKKRPRLSITVCGQAVAADLDAFIEVQAEELRARSDGARQDGSNSDLASATERLAQNKVIQDRAQAELSSLASERTRVVRQSMIDRHGIDPGRIGECRATYQPEDTERPRTEIHF